jgi:spermidine synthase
VSDGDDSRPPTADWRPSRAKQDWFAEPPLRGFQQRVQTTKVCYRKESCAQRIEVVDSVPFGRMLVLDGAVQTTERDEFIYHEMLVHPALLCHPDPRQVLLIGGGDGGALRRILQHPVSTVTMVELDSQVVEVSQRYLPSVGGTAILDHRASLLIEDGVEFVKHCDLKLDAVIVDSTDPVGPAKALFAEEFYRSVHRILADDGVFVTQSGSPLLMPAELHETYHNLRQVFPVVRLYLTPVPSYPGTLWSFTFASKGRDPLGVEPGVIRQRLSDRAISPHFYTSELHFGAFALPSFVEEALKGGRPIDLLA